MKSLTQRMKAMVIASEPGAFGRDEDGHGVELKTGADYAVARALEKRELGSVEGGGGGLPGLYFNNEDGVQSRADLLGIEPGDGLGDDDDYSVEAEAEANCGRYAGGGCALAGTEWCDWECPFS